MMKKRYITPQIEVLELETTQLMLTASGETSSSGTGSGSADDTSPDLATDRRGSWGNLWN